MTSFQHPVLLAAAAVAGLGLATALFCPSPVIAAIGALTTISITVGLIFTKRMQE